MLSSSREVGQGTTLAQAQALFELDGRWHAIHSARERSRLLLDHLRSSAKREKEGRESERRARVDDFKRLLRQCDGMIKTDDEAGTGCREVLEALEPKLTGNGVLVLPREWAAVILIGLAKAFHKRKRIWLNLRYESVSRRGSNGEVVEGTERPTETRRRRARGPRDMVRQKKRREGTDIESASVKALREEVDELRIAKFEAECQTAQEEDKEKEVKLPTEVWAIIAEKLDKNDVCSFALVSKQLREAQVLAGRELVTRPYYWGVGGLNVASFTEDWCAYWSRKFIEDHTDSEVIKRVLYVAARQGCLEVFEKYWSQGPQEKLSQLWDERTCGLAAFSGHLEVMKWLRAKGCPWGFQTSYRAAEGGHLEVLQWMRAQDPPCPWDKYVCFWAACEGHLEVLRWARSQGCPWGDGMACAAAEGGQLKVLKWLEFITTNGLNGHDKTKRAYTNTLKWLEFIRDAPTIRERAVLLL
ncbi:hypothetical protein HKI87_07g48630 [Chloropicon roscoffensis]|uniref:F-box domain-containing protein n=1 Tax=Chloropicon roscoffensis TaxID=1461544 RepID=A0AAX4PBI7_9CHLO